MKRMNKKNGSRILAGLLVFFLLIGVVMTPSLHANRRICRRALHRCAADATIAGMTGGPLAFAIWGAGCLIGYDFCLKYYH
jgi:hypothetical protein